MIVVSTLPVHSSDTPYFVAIVLNCFSIGGIDKAVAVFQGRIDGVEASLVVKWVLLQILIEEVCEFIPGDEVLGLALAYQLSIAAVVEVAVRCTGDDEQLFVLWIGIGLAHDIISLGLAFHHI